MLYSIIDRYIAKTLLSMIFIVLLTLAGLSAIIKFIEQFRFVDNGDYQALEALLYVLMRLPYDIQMFLPMAALLGSLIALGNLASSSELVVLQSAGISRFKIGVSVLKTAVPLVLCGMVMAEWVTPKTQKAAEEYFNFKNNRPSAFADLNRMWVKSGDEFVFIIRAKSTELTGISIWQVEKNKLKRLTLAKNATYVSEGQWQLNEVRITDFSQHDQLKNWTLGSQRWDTNLDPDKFNLVQIRPRDLSLSQTYAYIEYLNRIGQDAVNYELIFWKKAFQPVSMAVMVLLALSFVFGPLRGVTMGARVLSGILAGFGFHILNEFFGPASILFGFPPWLGVLIPALLFLGVTGLLMRRQG